MNEYRLQIFLEPHKIGFTGTRHLFMNVNADSKEQAIDFGKQMLQPLLKDGVELDIIVE